MSAQHVSRANGDLPRVLFCAADVGCGHGRAAMAVMIAMRRAHPLLRTSSMDALQYTPRWFNHMYRDMYVAAAKHLPRFNGWLYDSTDVEGTPKQHGIAAAIEMHALERFCRADEVQKADLIICTHFLCARVFSRLRARGELRSKLAVVITDQHPHAVWRVPHADLFMVASDHAAEEMARNGIEPRRTVVTGIPIDSRFDRPMSRDEARFRQQLPLDKPIILLTGGGLGLGGLDKALDGILQTAGDCFTVVVCGHNHALEQQLIRRMNGHFHNRCRILGVTTKMHELMAAADVMVGKPGGLTTAEAAARSLPMVLLRPIPGQEERNAQIMVRSQAAIRCDDPFAAGKAATALILKPNEIVLMRHGAQGLGRPCSARSAAEAAMALCSTESAPEEIPTFNRNQPSRLFRNERA